MHLRKNIIVRQFLTKLPLENTARVLPSMLIVMLILTANLAQAGTETGEWCPTCPDWTNYDSWSEWADDQRAAEIQDASSSYQSSPVRQIGMVSRTSDQQHARSPEIDRMEADAYGARPAEILVSITDLSESDIILDISPEVSEFIAGAININYEDFLDNSSNMRSAKEISEILGRAGISRNDSIVITGECLPCGGGPAPAAYSYWVLKYLGHDRVRILDGGIEDARAAGFSISNQSATRNPTVYEIQMRPELLATYDFAKNGGAQIVDARSPESFERGSIPGSVNIPIENILDNERMLNISGLEEVFSLLDKDRPVVVYTNIGVQASVSWFALKLLGYDARLYSWKDWLENQPRLNLELAEVNAEPNPVQSGEAITITATLRKGAARNSDVESAKEMLLTVKGCSTCAFGSPQSFSKIDQTNGIVQLGSNPTASEAADASLKCTASIKSPDGSEVDKVSLLRTTGERYVGLWNSRVPTGVYKISIQVFASGISKTFSDVLELEVVE